MRFLLLPFLLPGNLARAGEADLVSERWIDVDDASGRMRRVRAAYWLEHDLASALTEAGSSADRLYSVVSRAIEAGGAHLLEGAVARLEAIEGLTARVAVSRALILHALHREGEAEQILRGHVRLHGMTALVATGLARVLWASGRKHDARAQLRQALALNPNLETALHWWAVMHGSEGGDASYESALLDVARDKNAWRARLLLVRHYSQHGQVDRAREFLNRLQRDFADQGEIRVLLETERLQLEEAEDALVHAPGVSLPAEPQPHTASPRLGSIPLLSPVWMRALDDPAWILEPCEPPTGPHICVFAFADEAPEPPRGTCEAAESPRGRLTRAVALYLADLLAMTTDSPIAAIFPVELGVGMHLSTEPYRVDELLHWCPQALHPRIAICGSFDRNLVRLEMWDVQRQERLLGEGLAGSDAVASVGRLYHRVMGKLYDDAMVCARPLRGDIVPALERLGEPYLHALSRLLTQVLSAGRLVAPLPKWQEARIYADYFALVALYPDLLAPRLMAISGVLSGIHQGSDEARAWTGAVRDLLVADGPHARALARLAPVVYRGLGDLGTARSEAAKFLECEDGAYRRWLTHCMQSM